MPFFLKSQTKNTYTLAQVIELARSQSPSFLQAKNNKLNRFWQYRTYLSNYMPQLALSGTLPNYNRSIQPITLPDGTVAYINQSLAQNNLQLSLVQNIGLTGGTISVNSSVGRIDIFGNNTNTSFLSTPMFISINQPLFQYNRLKWDKKIEPLRFQESQRKYNEDLEALSVRATQLYFDVLLSQITIDLANKNLANNDTIFQISQGRFSMGKIAENELLQVELSVMNARQQLTQAQLELQNNLLSIKIFLGNKEEFGNFLLQEPQDLPDFEINEQIALEQAKQNRERYIAFKRRKLEAEAEVARAKGNTGLQANISASFGLTQTALTLTESYQNPKDQQIANVTFQVPLVTWGRRQAQVKTAIANEEVQKSIITQEELTFEQEVLQKARQLKILKEQLKIARKSDDIGQRSYDIAQQRYLISKITINELINILQAKDNAKRNYLFALRNFWIAHFELRQLTLYDFEKNSTITYE